MELYTKEFKFNDQVVRFDYWDDSPYVNVTELCEAFERDPLDYFTCFCTKEQMNLFKGDCPNTFSGFYEAEFVRIQDNCIYLEYIAAMKLANYFSPEMANWLKNIIIENLYQEDQ